MTLTIRPAGPDDAPLVLAFIRALAEYEKLLDDVKATDRDIRAALFGPAPKVFCEIAEWNGEPAGFALWYYTFSTFLGRHGLFLEDLFVKPEMRGHGIGKALLATLARRCVDEGLGRFEWEVLDWNQPSIDFYKAQGAELMTGWEPCRVTGDALRRLAASAP
ncbi:GNAT family N-acetyltransferase [Chthonobacter rhizosphaerae]|uniref:GNAT family N-acetyltransferase n=1 Tax=Chthonobacter rhizosphaerae TaxID=2735553 RepID=UPI0015EF6A21|nr:GNAT family N-acetyltransferase [Chthonobacter rhizosphaerae]